MNNDERFCEEILSKPRAKQPLTTVFPLIATNELSVTPKQVLMMKASQSVVAVRHMQQQPAFLEDNEAPRCGAHEL